MSDELISLADKLLEEKISLYGPQAPATLPDDVADQRARKYSYAFSDDPEAPSLDEMRSSVQVGDEDSQRRRALASQQMQDIQARQNVIRKVIAARGNQPLSFEDTDMIMNVSKQSLPYTLDNIFEKEYANKTVTAHSLLSGAGTSDEEHAVMDQTANVLSRRERFQKIAEDVQARYQSMSGIESGWDFAKSFLPFKSWWDIKHTINSKETVSSFLKGNAMEDIVRSYWLMGEDEAATKARQDIEDLAGKNIYDAIALSQALLHFSGSEKFLENLGSGADLSTIPALKFAKSAKNLIKAATTNKLDTVEILNATGNVEEAARATIIDKITPKKIKRDMSDFDILKNDIPTVLNPKEVIESFRPTVGLSRELANRLVKNLDDNAAQFLDQLRDVTIPVERLDRRTQAWKLAEAQADERLRQAFPRLEDGVLNIRTIYPEETAANVGFRQMEIGQRTDALGKAAEASDNTTAFLQTFKAVSGEQLPYFTKSQIANDKGFLTPSSGAAKPYTLEERLAAAREATPASDYQHPRSAVSGQVRKVAPAFEEGESKIPQAANVGRYTKKTIETSKMVESPVMNDVVLTSANQNNKYAVRPSGIEGSTKALSSKIDTTTFKLSKQGTPTYLKADNDVIESISHGTPTTFKTAKGSEYTVLPDGTTRRNKALRDEPGHEGDQGIKADSQKTHYVSSSDATKLADFQAQHSKGVKVAIREYKDGRIGLYYVSGKDKGKFEARTMVKPLDGPQIGAIPVELWHDGTKVHFGNKIVEINPGLESKGFSNGIVIELGKPDAKPFQSEQIAQTFAKSVYGLEEGSYTIEAKAPNSYFIGVKQTIDETSPTVRAQLAIDTEWSKTNTTSIGRMLSAVRSGDARIAEETMNQERKNATFGSAQFMSLIGKMQKEDIFSLQKSDKEGWKRFNQFIEAQRRFIKDGKVGKFSETLADFETDWKQSFGKTPSYEEARAYWSYKQMSDFDYTIRNLNVYRDKARLGMMEFGLPTVKGQKAGTPFVEGRIVDSIPEHQGYFPNVALWDADPNLVRTLQTGENPLTRAQISELLATGRYKIIQLSPYSMDQIKGMNIKGLDLGDRPIRYILTDDYSQAPLRAKQLPYQPGGHIEYTTEFFISQPNVKVNSAENINFKYSTYYGDNNLHGIDTRAEGEKFVKAYQEAINLWKSKDARFDSYVAKNLPYTGSELAKLLEKGTIDPNAPVMLRGKNKSLWETNPEYLRNNFVNLRRDTDDPHNIFQGQIDLAYATERNAPITTIVNQGSEANPVFQFRPARMVDAMSSMNRAMTDLVKGRWLEDLKIKAVEDFHAKFGDLVMGDSQQSFWNNPFKNLLDPKWAATTDLERLQAAKNYRRATLEFLNALPDEYVTLKNFQESVLSTIKEKVGQSVFETAELWMLHRSNSPVATIRNIAFRSSQALFNPAVFLTQALTSMNAVAVSPINGMKGLAAATMTNMIRYNDSPSHMAAYSKIMEAFGMSSKDFQESVAMLKRSGMMDVGAEHAYLDTFKQSQVKKSKMGEFLDTSAIFFNEGEKFTRMTSWHTSFLDWREANPTKVVTNRDLKEIMNRADAMGVNMTRASNAAWQQGLMSIPAQFQGYYARMLDMTWGGSAGVLSQAERARIFAMNSALYGIPASLGAYIAFYPVNDVIREGMKKKGIDPDENVVSKILDQGLVGPMLEVVTGRKLDIGAKYGPSGQDWFRDLANGEEGIMTKVLGGVSGRTLKQYWESTYPFRAAFLGAIGYYPDYFPIQGKDFVNLFTDNISTLSNAAKAWGIINAHEYLTKRGDAIKDLPEWEGYLYALTGIKDAKITEAFTTRQVLQDIDSVQREYKNLYIRDMRAALNAGEDYKQMGEYLRRASGWIQLGKFRPDEITRMQKDALSGKWQDLATNLDLKLAKERPELTEAWLKGLKK